MTIDPLRASAITTQTTALVGLVGLALCVRGPLQLSVLFPLKAGMAFSVVMVLAIRHVRGHHPFARFGPANQITTVRAALVALLASLIGEPVIPIVSAGAVTASVVATLLDGVDGWVARRMRAVSAFGTRFDMETDAALIQVLAILVWQYGKAGPWVLVSGLLRYAFVAAGWLWPWMTGPLAATRRAKIICVVQIVALIVAIAPAITPPTSSVVAAAALLALCCSFLVDTLRLWRRTH